MINVTPCLSTSVMLQVVKLTIVRLLFDLLIDVGNRGLCYHHRHRGRGRRAALELPPYRPCTPSGGGGAPTSRVYFRRPAGGAGGPADAGAAATAAHALPRHDVGLLRPARESGAGGGHGGAAGVHVPKGRRVAGGNVPGVPVGNGGRRDRQGVAGVHALLPRRMRRRVAAGKQYLPALPRAAWCRSRSCCGRVMLPKINLFYKRGMVDEQFLFHLLDFSILYLVFRF